MSFTAQHLYDLLPAIIRVRDSEADGPLKALITVLAEQIGVLEEDLAQLHDDQFIETCATWVAPYIGDLIGYRTLYGVSPKTGSPRAEVANTIAYRRRKGTASVLEQLARDVTGWNARVVEFFELLATTQYMNHTRSFNHYAPNLRDWEKLEYLDTPFDTIAHTVDVGRIGVGEGLHNILNIGLFLWRLDAQSLTRSPAFRVDADRFMFSPLGNNTPLFTLPQAEDQITHIAEPINVPNPISRAVLDAYPERYYGDGLSLVIDGQPIADVHACNLEDDGGGWAHTPAAGEVAIDPELGRIAFASGEGPEDLSVTFHHGFSADMGGGEYERGTTFEDELTPVEQVTSPASIQTALDNVTAGGAVQIDDTGRYEQALAIDVDADAELELRAANAHRPTIVLDDELVIRGGEDSSVTLNGLLITGAGLRVPAADNELRLLRLRHCTLVPGIALDIDGQAIQAGVPSLIVELDNVTVEIENCIVGGMRCAPGSTVDIHDSIVDANDPSGVAFADTDDDSAGAVLKVDDTTFIGKVHTRRMELTSNAIFNSELAETDTWAAAVISTQKQNGCVRFSYVPSESRVPRQYRCQPTLAIETAVAAALAANPALTELEQEALAASVTAGELARLVPAFTDRRYGRPGYAQLSRACPVEIRTGADDESEMGVFHDLFQPQRLTNLDIRLQEYLRVGLQAGVFCTT
jgi:hypothetical protein